MAFQSYNELISMASRNPKQAKQYVTAAQQSSRPVVSADNPGYGENPRAGALKRSMSRNKPMMTPQDDAVQQRKNVSY